MKPISLAKICSTYISKQELERPLLQRSENGWFILQVEVGEQYIGVLYHS
jgi:hypothetical protein